MSTIATKIDLRFVPTTILDQGQLNTCAENAMAADLNIIMKQAHHDILPVSRMQSYADARIASREFGVEYGDVGTYPTTMFSQAMQKGLASESLWQYDESNLYVKPTANVYSDAANHKLLGYTEIGAYQNYGGIRDSISKALVEGKPVLLSFNVRDYFFAESGPLNKQIGFGDGSQAGGHMALIVGKDDKLNGGSYIVQNSWGTNWGDNGYGTIKYTQFSSHIDDFKAAYVLNGFDGLNLTWTDARVNVAQHYAAIMGRAGELSGVDFYANANVTDEALTGFMLNSAEGQSIYGNKTNAEFVETMYENVLGRHADADGLNFYTNALNNGYTRTSIMNMVINAVETSTNDQVSKDFLANKTNLSSYISITMQYQGGQDVVTHNELAQVTSDANQLEIIKVGLAHDLGYY